MDVRDAHGRELKVGDWVSYPVRQSSYMYVPVGQITEIATRKFTQFNWQTRAYEDTEVPILKVRAQKSNYLNSVHTYNTTVYALNRVTKTFPPEFKF